jgi:protein ImuA
MSAAEAATLSRLRQAVAKIEGSDLSALETGGRVLPLGAETIDAALGGGLALGSLHELAPAGALHFGAAAGFALAFAARAGTRKHTLWIQPDFAGTEMGALFGPGLTALGLPMERLLLLRVARAADVLWAMEEGLKSRVLSAVVAELTDDGACADLTATRRLALAARDGGGLGFLLRHRFSPEPSAAATRWDIAAAPSAPDAFGGLGRTAFTLSLLKNRRGPLGRWTIEWDHHARVFAPLSVAMAEAALDRPDRAPLVCAG